MEKKEKKSNIFSKSLFFVKGNLNIIYSLLLLIFIPAAFFINNYLMNSNYEKAIDQMTRSNAAKSSRVICKVCWSGVQASRLLILTGPAVNAIGKSPRNYSIVRTRRSG
ncbi:MAG: hypothetical protein NTX14_00860 [Candidatus Nealsonbacteria bacterium]|nr:hypothetical protein [Candidatus Nealsonbacteria bacterium]